MIIDEALEFLDSLDRTDSTAFLALFAGARLYGLRSFNGECPGFGKAECEWPEDWRDLYENKLPGAGLTTFAIGERRPALGMAAGSYCEDITIATTEFGFEVREAWWKRLQQRVMDYEANSIG